MRKSTIKYSLPSAVNITSSRKEILKEIAVKSHELIKEVGHVNIIFVCTHNSRRSQAAELWAREFAFNFDLHSLSIYSAGTEKTALNQRMISAIKRAGFKVESDVNNDEEIHRILSPFDSQQWITFSSKTIHDSSLPTQNVIAIMTCTDADENCPVVSGALHRIPLRYQDPGDFDDSLQECKAYDDAFHLIGKEMHYLFKELNDLINHRSIISR